jgi:uncharacterized protein
LKATIQGNRILPRFLDERDHVWLRLLKDEFERFLGRRRRELKDRLKRPLPFAAPPHKVDLVSYVLLRSIKTEIRSKIHPEKIRAEVFRIAAKLSAPRADILAQAAARLSIPSDELEEELFGDFPEERYLSEVPLKISAQELALRANLMLVQGLIARSTFVKVLIEGNSRTVVQTAKKKGLICVVEKNNERSHTVLGISGPYALFRKTTMYGRALSEIIPYLGWCPKFKLRAECVFKKYPRIFELSSTDPIFPSDPPPLYDSKLEEEFARKFRKLTSNWDLIREPEPIKSGETLIFPDFRIQHQSEPSRRWFLEIMGYWTKDYVKSKLDRLNKIHVDNFILCIRDDYNCSSEDLPSDMRIVRFKGSVDPSVVLEIVESKFSSGS